MHAYLLHVCNNCVRMPLHVHSTSVSVHMQTCVCVYTPVRAPEHTCRGGCVYASVCTRPHGSLAAPTPGCARCPPRRLSPKTGWQRGHGQVGCLGWGHRSAPGSLDPPLLSPFPTIGAGQRGVWLRSGNKSCRRRARADTRAQTELGAAPHTPLFPSTHPPCPASSPAPLEMSSCFPPFPLHPFALESSELVSRRGSRQKELQRGCFPQPAAIDK